MFWLKPSLIKTFFSKIEFRRSVVSLLTKAIRLWINKIAEWFRVPNVRLNFGHQEFKVIKKLKENK